LLIRNESEAVVLSKVYLSRVSLCHSKPLSSRRPWSVTWYSPCHPPAAASKIAQGHASAFSTQTSNETVIRSSSTRSYHKTISWRIEN